MGDSDGEPVGPEVIGDEVGDSVVGGDEVGDSVVGGDEVGDSVVGGDGVGDSVVGGDGPASTATPRHMAAHVPIKTVSLTRAMADCAGLTGVAALEAPVVDQDWETGKRTGVNREREGESGL